MRTITDEELKEILENHRKRLNGEADGVRADLSNADLRGADLSNAYLRCADLRNADLRGADLSNADLRGANIHYADLRGANIHYADLRGADLRNADLRGADLRDANLYGTNLNSVYRRWLVIAEHIGSRRSQTIYFADYDNIICGCWNKYMGGTLNEFKKRINEIYPADSKNVAHQRYRIEYLSAIKMFESMREAYIKNLKEKKNND